MKQILDLLFSKKKKKKKFQEIILNFFLNNQKINSLKFQKVGKFSKYFNFFGLGLLGNNSITYLDLRENLASDFFFSTLISVFKQKKNLKFLGLPKPENSFYNQELLKEIGENKNLQYLCFGNVKNAKHLNFTINNILSKRNLKFIEINGKKPEKLKLDRFILTFR